MGDMTSSDTSSSAASPAACPPPPACAASTSTRRSPCSSAAATSRSRTADFPYYLGGVIEERHSLLLQTPESLGSRFGLDVRVRTEAVSIDREAKTVRVRDVPTGEETDEVYDALVLSPGPRRCARPSRAASAC